METNQAITEKINFLKKDLIEHLQKLHSEDKGQWGVLNAQQMVEHLSDAFTNYYGFDSKKILTPVEHLPRMKEFMMSEKQFKPNTKNVEMPEVPNPERNKDMKTALEELQNKINDFFIFFEEGKDKTVVNLFFGELNFEETVQLLHKHTLHHLRQFSVID